jgi:hypothetical protein
VSGQRSRHILIQAIVRGSPAFGSRVELNHVDDELAELGRCTGLQPLHRQRLLQVFHATRALDTCLAVVLSMNGQMPKHGLGKMLHQLRTLPQGTRGYLSHSAASAFASAIAYKRNHYAHRAGSFPTSTQEVDRIVAEVHACLVTVL